MTRTDIIEQLELHHKAFVDYVSNLSDDDFTSAATDKWSAGQQMEHIRRSIRPLAQGLVLPVFILKIVFGKANRPSKEYDALIEKYQSALKKGGRATGAFIPPVVHADQKAALNKAITKLVHTLCRQIERCSEADLDQLILPHPLMGKLTLREMMYFTIYHVQHHQALISQGLLAK